MLSCALKVYLLSSIRYSTSLRSHLALVLGSKDQGRAVTPTAVSNASVIVESAEPPDEGVTIRGIRQIVHPTPRLRKVNVGTAIVSCQVPRGQPWPHIN